jgi:hypothetical protein
MQKSIMILSFLLFSFILPLSVLSLQDIDHRHLVGPFDLDPDLDCAMRNLTWAYSQSLLPERGSLVEVFDALRLSIDCNMTRPSSSIPPNLFKASSKDFAATYYADAENGVDDDQRSGGQGDPFKTVEFAVMRARVGAQPAQILLQSTAPFYLPSPLILTSADSGLSISAVPGATSMPIISGGTPLVGLSWSSVGVVPGSGTNGTPIMTLWKSSLNQKNLLPFDQLFLNGRRATRARYPNGNPEINEVPIGYTKANDWLPPPPFNNDLVQQNPLHTPLVRKACSLAKTPCEPGGDSGGGPPWAIFCCFFWGWNATAANWTTGSFWGTQPGPPGGGTAQMPGGLKAGNDTLPRMAQWTNWKNAYVHAFHNSYWGNWMWQIQDINTSDGTIAFSRGGFQEARGSGKGDYLYYDNIFSELDFAGEWFHDEENSLLFYVVNGTDAPSGDDIFIAAQMDNILSILGDTGVPAVGIELAGIAFMHTLTTFMEPFLVGSGGDMSFHDGGAVRISGTEDVTIRDSLFTNIGGTGVMISGYNRDAIVEGNEFVFLGESAILSAGLTAYRQNNLDGDFPARSRILRNYAHEFGLYVKQTGFYYQAMTANTTLEQNVMFNGPRAGINFNDGFAGGHSVKRNVAFNLVRATSDHGPFNSWDRNTYQAHAWDPTNLETIPISIDQNLFVNNYNSFFPVDNDDGSNAYVVSRNFFLWGGAKNLMGYNKAFLSNIYVYADYSPITSPRVKDLGLPRGNHNKKYSGSSQPDGLGISSRNGYSTCTSTIAPFASATLGLADQFRDNVCITSSSDHFFDWYNPCNKTNPTDGSMWLMSDNIYRSADGGYVNRCDNVQWNLTAAQALGVDVGSVATTLPALSELIAMGHAVLEF